MTARGALGFLWLAALLGLAAGCSRTYDGSLVPTYGLATERFAGIPFLSLKPTPLDPPNMRGIAPPPAVASDDTLQASQTVAAQGEAARPRAARRSPPRRKVAPQPVARGPLKCRDEAPGPRLVRMVCD